MLKKKKKVTRKVGEEFHLTYEEFKDTPVLGKLYKFDGYNARLVCREDESIKFIIE